MSPDLGSELYGLARELEPICRSITGDGVRATLDIISRHIALDRVEVPTGTRVLDWVVPKEWNVREAYIADSGGRRVVDVADSCLHVLGYSAPVRARLTLAELRDHLYTLLEHPSWVPYRTSYYEERWGFCLSHERLEALPEDEYEVVIDATLEPGHLTLGELYLPGADEREVLVSCHVCHPALANDGLAGMAVATFLAREVSGWQRRLSYRFLFAPGTIGAITWLALNEERVGRVYAGLVLACIGDPGRFTYKRSRHGNTPVDRAVDLVLRHSGHEFEVRDFTPYGYDERQFCSPGFDLPVGCLMRTPYGEYPQYHTSADDLTLVRPESLADSLTTCTDVLRVIEGDRCYRNLFPKGEPQLGRRGLYGSLGGSRSGRERELAMLWMLNLSDGAHSLLDVATRADLPFSIVKDAADLLLDAGLLAQADAEGER